MPHEAAGRALEQCSGGSGLRLRAFGWFVGLLVLALLIGACVAYPAYQLVAGTGWAFHRVASRVAMLILAVELVWYCRRFGLNSRRDFGYGLPRGRFLGQAALWGLVGIGTGALGAWFLLGTGLRTPTPGLVPSAANALHLFLVGLGSGITVALLEETAMRGGLHTAIEAESGAWSAAVLTAVLFALLHFFAKVSIPPQQLAWGSGFDLLLRSFAPLLHPLAVLDAFSGWLIVGLILSLTRVLTGNIAVAIGLHAGWVVVLRMLAGGTTRGASADYAAWVGSFDGLLGYWLLPWGAAIALGLWLLRARWVPAASSMRRLNGR